MKFYLIFRSLPNQKSPPVRGAWVEILNETMGGQEKKGRPLCGGRGLKSVCRISAPAWRVSPPVRGAWVEIPVCAAVPVLIIPSPPVRGAWVEMTGRSPG